MGMLSSWNTTIVLGAIIIALWFAGRIIRKNKANKNDKKDGE